VGELISLAPSTYTSQGSAAIITPPREGRRDFKGYMVKIKDFYAEDTKIMSFIRRPGKLPVKTSWQAADKDFLGYTREKHLEIIQKKLHKGI
jgi:hypothetical protein